MRRLLILPFHVLMRPHPIRFLSVLVLAWCCLVGVPMVAHSAQASAPTPAPTVHPFLIGVAPYSSARAILQEFAPLRAVLQTDLARPVEVRTAPSFLDFARRGLRGDYDLAVTTAHQALLLRDDAGYIPLVTYTAPFESVIVVRKDGSISSAQDLNGKLVLGLGQASLVTLWDLHWLDTQHVSVQTRTVAASDSQGRLLISKDADAALMSLANFQALAPAVRDHLTLLARSGSMPGRIYLLNPRWKAQTPQVLHWLYQYADSPEGRAHFAAYHLGTLRALEPGELSAMRPYAQAVRQELAGSSPHGTP